MLERAPAFTEVGAGVAFTRNGMAALEALRADDLVLAARRVRARGDPVSGHGSAEPCAAAHGRRTGPRVGDRDAYQWPPGKARRSTFAQWPVTWRGNEAERYGRP